MKTIKAMAIIGINAGYHHQNNLSTMSLAEFGSLYQQIADEVFTETNIYVGACISPVKVEYKTDWGCPIGGEDSIRIEADCNPSYSNLPEETYMSLWREVFIKICRALMKELQQSTVTVSFSSTQLEYLK